MIKNIIHFIKYHNATTIALAFLLLATGGAFASEDTRKAVIGEQIVERQGIDNSFLLASSIDAFDFAMQITNVEKDASSYYVEYIYNTLAIQDNAWQEVAKQNTLKVSKQSLAGKDLGLYAQKQLSEVTDSQLAFLKEAKKQELAKGKTVARETIKYTGLVGLILDPKTKELPGYEPVVKPAEIVRAPNSFDSAQDVPPTEETVNETTTSESEEAVVEEEPAKEEPAQEAEPEETDNQDGNEDVSENDSTDKDVHLETNEEPTEEAPSDNTEEAM
ncbi:MAG: hypothetical protein Q8O94_03665 [bacterium]|nr:hypothetical protein [bacterium]